MKLSRSLLIAVFVVFVIGGTVLARSVNHVFLPSIRQGLNGDISRLEIGNDYTGCLHVDGNIRNVAIGPSPTQPCKEDEIQIGWNKTGPEGPQGPRGEIGPQGPQGPQGPPVSFYVNTGPAHIASTATCNAGDQATGGGWVYVRGGYNTFTAYYSFPIGNPPNAWHVRVAWRDEPDGNLSKAYVVCADLP